MTTSRRLPLDLQGHRGARGLLPENTLPAFARALEIGVTTLELDCAVTRDRIVVVSHDTRLNPEITRDAAGVWLNERGPPIWQLTYEALQRYDVGRIDPASEYARRFPHQQPVDGTRIPRLTDVFELVRHSGDERVRFNIETKLSPLEPEETASPEVFVAALLRVVRDAGMAGRVGIQSFDWRTLALMQETAPRIPTIYLTAEQDWTNNVCRSAGSSPWTAPHHVSQHGGSLPRTIRAAGGAMWSPYYQEASRETVDEAHALGLEVVVWTVNDERNVARMMALGVDGIISDYPDLLVRVADAAR